VKILADTHCFLWFVNNDPQLSTSARNLIVDPANDILLSLASVWEISVKVGINKLTLAQPVQLFIRDQTKRNNIKLLNIGLSDVLFVSNLPRHHGDPFDRLLIAQSLRRSMPIISIDAKFDAYGVDRRF
jgi:PIN domain nuclease of toxin-antitoxin system